MDNDRIVFPGSFLGYGEEVMPGSNAYESDEGNVYSEVVGVKEVDSRAHEAKVEGSKPSVELIEKGSIVIGVVSLVKTSSVMIDLFEAQKNGRKQVVNMTMASLYISNISNEYVERTSDKYRVGDIIKARVIDVKPYGIELETKAPDLGVIKAFGIRSRRPLEFIGGNLRDPITADIETRKISTDYVLR